MIIIELFKFYNNALICLRMPYSMILFGFGESKHMFSAAKKLSPTQRVKFNPINSNLKQILHVFKIR